jgi:xanthine dehydrogenase accessory factor
MIILGCGHISVALSRMATLAGFETWVYDDRPAFANRERFPEAKEVIMDDFAKLREHIDIRRGDYVVVVTRGHKHDQACLEAVLKGTYPAYLGMIGSKRRVAVVMKQLEEEGYAKELLSKVYSPIGLKIGAITPEEIAVSILAEVIACKYGRTDHAREAKSSAVKASANKTHVWADSVREDPYATCDTEAMFGIADGSFEGEALITIVDAQGSVPRGPGAIMSMTYDGRISGTIGGGCAEGDMLAQAREVIRKGGYALTEIDMTDTAEEDGMVCGGRALVLIEKL